MEAGKSADTLVVGKGAGILDTELEAAETLDAEVDTGDAELEGAGILDAEVDIGDVLEAELEGADAGTLSARKCREEAVGCGPVLGRALLVLHCQSS